MDDRDAIGALVSDLHWQIDQMSPRKVKNAAGKPYTPAYYKRGLENATDRGGLAVAEYVRGYLYRPPSDGYKKLEDADSLDLACEALVAEDAKSYAQLFTDEDRAAARKRLAPHQAAIEARKAGIQDRIAATRKALPAELDALRAEAGRRNDSEDAVAINSEILERDPEDVVALNRLGRALEGLGQLHDAREAFQRVLALDRGNAIATGRLTRLGRRER
jgi:tetratricopeptide (TPR) repeat protein